MGIERDAPLVVPDVRRLEIERVHVGDAAGAVHDAIGLDEEFLAVAFEGDAKAGGRRLDFGDLDAGLDADAEPFALRLQARNSIDKGGGQQSR